MTTRISIFDRDGNSLLNHNGNHGEACAAWWAEANLARAREAGFLDAFAAEYDVDAGGDAYLDAIRARVPRAVFHVRPDGKREIVEIVTDDPREPLERARLRTSRRLARTVRVIACSGEFADRRGTVHNRGRSTRELADAWASANLPHVMRAERRAETARERVNANEEKQA
jgi:hypothetical protein